MKAFFLSFFFLNSICDLSLQIKRGSKNKRKLEQPVSSQRISNTPFHVVTCCLFTLSISMDELNIEHPFIECIDFIVVGCSFTVCLHPLLIIILLIITELIIPLTSMTFKK